MRLAKYSATLIAILLALAVLVLICPSLVVSQSNTRSPQFNIVIQDVLRAESAGATPEELKVLTGQLNSILSLQDKLLNPEYSNRHSQILAQISNASASVDLDAKQVQITASHRTFTAHVIAYSLAGVGALCATIVSHYAISLWRKARNKRVLQLRFVSRE